MSESDAPPSRPRRHRPGSSPGTPLVDRSLPAPKLSLCGYGPEGTEELAEVTLEQVHESRDRWAVTWLNVDGLGDPETLLAIGRQFGLHRLVVEDVANTHHRPKAESYDDTEVIIARMIAREGPRATEQVTIILKPGLVISFQERVGDWFDPVRERIRHGRGLIRKSGADYLAYALLDAIVDSFLPAVDELGEEIEGIEQAVLGRPSNDAMSHIHRLKRRLITLRRVAWSQREAVGFLLRYGGAVWSDETHTHLRDVRDHAYQVVELLDSQREIASGLMELCMTLQGQRLNEIMKVLTIMASIFIPLSFVAGLYGMNFDPAASSWNMPELSWRYGYPAVLLLMLACAAGMLAVFWRRGWLGPAADRPDAEDDLDGGG